MDVAEYPVAANEDPDELIPLRGESFSAEHLELHFQQLSHRQVLMPRNWAGKDFSKRFERHAAAILNAQQRVTASIQAAKPIPPEAEWLLDNFYVVEEQLREIRDDLPRGFYRELPKTSSGYPRVYEFARELIVHSDSSMDADLIERCTHSFQTLSPLSIGETWAVPSCCGLCWSRISIGFVTRCCSHSNAAIAQRNSQKIGRLMAVSSCS